MGGCPRPPGRQGREPGGDDADRGARAPRVHGHDRGLHRLPRGGGPLSEGHLGGADQRAPPDPDGDGQGVRQPGATTPRLLPLRREVLDARNDGHDPEPRDERRGRTRAGRAHRRPALRLRRLPAGDPDVRERRARDGRRDLRGDAPPPADRGRRRHRSRARGGRLDGAHPALQGTREGAHPRAVPAGSAGAAQVCHGGGLRVVEREAGRRLPGGVRHPPRHRHGRQHPDDGIREHGTELGDGGRHEPQSLDRRAGAGR